MMTISTKEGIVLIHHYRDDIVATALRYLDEVRDSSDSPELEDLLEPSDEVLALATKHNCSRIREVLPLINGLWLFWLFGKPPESPQMLFARDPALLAPADRC